MEYRLIFNFLLAIFPRENKQPRGKYILRGDIMRYKIEMYALKCFTNLLFLLFFFPIFRSTGLSSITQTLLRKSG